MDPAPAAPKQNGRKVTGFIFAGILALAVVLAIAWYINYKKYHIATDDAYVTGRVHVIAAKVPGTVRALWMGLELSRRGSDDEPFAGQARNSRG